MAAVLRMAWASAGDSPQGHHPNGQGFTGARTLPQQVPASTDAAKARFRMGKMDCPTEERLTRNRLKPMQGVVRLDCNLLARKMTAFFD